MRQHRGYIATLLFLALALEGCGSILFRNPITIRVETNVPASAKELEEGHSGSTPGEISMSRGRDHTLEVSAPGYVTQRVKVETHLSWWRILTSVVLNGGHGLFTLFITTVLGCGVDLDSGAWQYLDDPVAVTLERGEGGPPVTASTPKPTVSAVTTKPTTGKKFCGTCGEAQSSSATFCGGCGAKQ